ncbi:MAG: NAD(P)H-hydrate dehydratase, partial [Desulfobulbaceae bacterium]|nr:NAD(P)H-hydrate dehydratase [Desulfobulbaceae bacterium]
PDTAQLVLSLYTELTIPAVIDADGLSILAATLSELTPAAPRILTPHPGEMARLTGKTTKDIQTDRLRTAASFAQENKVILVLKGSRTVIAAPDGRVAINPTGNPGMAAGGMGDVLTGLIAGFLAQGLSPWQAACLGVYLHGLAGDRIVKKTGMKAGFLASELAAEVPLAMEEIRGSEIKYSLFQGN